MPVQNEFRRRLLDARVRGHERRELGDNVSRILVALADRLVQAVAVVCMLAMIYCVVAGVVSRQMNIQTQFGGTSVLIVVGVLLDTIAQVEQHRTLRKYDSFMKTGRVKFRGRQQRFM